MQKNKIRIFSCYNFIDKLDESENEDSVAIHSNDTETILSMADGAGGSGIFSKLWSQKLVENPYRNHYENEDERNKWFATIAEEFYDSIEAKFKELDNRFVKNKFYEEGSFSTYLQAKIDHESNTLTYWGVGDTRLFLFRLKDDEQGYSLVNVYPVSDVKTLDDNPDLLNWNEAVEKWPKPEMHVLQENDVFVCCTDALANFFIRSLYHNRNTFLEDILPETLLNSLLGEDVQVMKFSPDVMIYKLKRFFELSKKRRINRLQRWMEQGLGFDDYTIAIYTHSKHD